jgi:hypothetical protein
VRQAKIIIQNDSNVKDISILTVDNVHESLPIITLHALAGGTGFGLEFTHYALCHDNIAAADVNACLHVPAFFCFYQPHDGDDILQDGKQYRRRRSIHNNDMQMP